MPVSRRSLLRNCASFPVYALVAELARAAPRTQAVPARRWLSLQSELARALAGGKISPADWHQQVNELSKDVDLESLAHELRRARIKDAGAPFGHDPQKRFVTILGEDDAPVRLGYGLALFDFGPESVITPHAHRYMASAHMVIDGRVRVRTFDRVKDEENFLILRPTQDTLAEPGHSAAMTSSTDNVHWFAPRSSRAMTIDVIIDGLDRGKDRYLIEPVDPLRGSQLSDGTIRAPLISFERSMELYRASS
ncbi:hypothetical protein [Ideonella sp. A 288]|uniref:hypothetical protein n=1 Tax=Ideonella sp. A 288 TaxID=1962181 RepID=UPI000B4C0D97|nr:hypothetical protein [Ideonella sp. A 288]